MKKIVLLSIVLLPALFIQAQEYTPIKNLAALQQYKKAKEDLDKEMGKAKFSSKPEAYILKTAVYAGMAADTNSLLLAGITAENNKNNDDAAKYYGRVADLKVTGPDFEGIYRFLVRHYFAKKDMANFEKYKALGKQFYPASEFFTYDKVDFAIGLEEDFHKKMQALEEVIAADPNSYKAYELLGG